MLLGGGAAEAYQIEQSLRFDGSSKLERSNSNDGSSRSFTLSYWIKKTYLGPDNAAIIGANDAGSNWAYISWGESSGDDDQLVGRANGSQSGYSNGYVFDVQRKHRDASAWQHHVLVVDKTAGTSKGYVNGVLDAGAGGYGGTRSSNGWTFNGTTSTVRIGVNAETGSSNYLSGFLAEWYFVDGTAMDETDFGEFDDNGVWRPIEPSISSYGTNGYYLKFDPSATNGVGHDHSGNGNNWTATGFTTSGTGSDVVNDTPTTNHATVLPAWPFGVSQAYARYFAEANLQYHSGRNSPALAFPSIMLPKSGKYYVEFTITAAGSGGSFYAGNVFVISAPNNGQSYGTVLASYEGGYGATAYNGSAGTSGSSWRSGPHNVAIAIDMDTGDVEFFLAGSSQSTGTISAANLALEPLCITASGATGSSTTVTYDLNFGTRDFVYTPPTGYTGLGTATMPEPDIKNPGENFKAVIYDGSNSSQSIDCGFQPDMIWIKCRSDARDHKMVDVLRGTTKYLAPNETYAESTHTDFVTSFNTDGFTVAGNAADTNQSGKTYVAWCWKAGGSGSSNTTGSITSTVSANPSAGFSIITYSGNSTDNSTIGHGLGVAPQMIITKVRTGASNEGWPVWHDSLGGNTKYLQLNQASAVSTDSNVYGGSNNTAPTSTVYSVGSGGVTNTSGRTYVAYCFAEVEGYSRFGSYIGNGSSSDGPFVYCGFKPALVITRRTDSGTDWKIWDNARGPINQNNNHVASNLNGSEQSDLGVDFLSNGFKLRNSGSSPNASGGAYIFMAWASSPFGGEGVSPATAR